MYHAHIVHIYYTGRKGATGEEGGREGREKVFRKGGRVLFRAPHFLNPLTNLV